jgi:hypothetical protein
MLVSLMEDRLLRATPLPSGGFDYTLLQCKRQPCAPPDCAADDDLPRGGVRCAAVGSGTIGSGVQHKLAEAAPLRLRGPRQQLLLDGGLPSAGPDGRQLLQYETATSRIAILSFSLPKQVAAAATASDQRVALAGGALSASCDALELPALFEGSWPFAEHALVTLGNGTVLDIVQSSAEFRVWQCDQRAIRRTKPPTPLSETAQVDTAPCNPVTHGIWPPLSQHTQVVWLGAELDVLLLFDSVSASYEFHRVSRANRRWMPQAADEPLSQGELLHSSFAVRRLARTPWAAHLPHTTRPWPHATLNRLRARAFSAMRAGVWPELRRHSLVHVGGGMLLAILAEQGEFGLMLLDRSILRQQAAQGGEPHSGRPPRLPPAMVTGRFSSDSLANPPAGWEERCSFDLHQLTYLGDDLLIDLEPATGACRPRTCEPTCAPRELALRQPARLNARFACYRKLLCFAAQPATRRPAPPNTHRKRQCAAQTLWPYNLRCVLRRAWVWLVHGNVAVLTGWCTWAVQWRVPGPLDGAPFSNLPSCSTTGRQQHSHDACVASHAHAFTRCATLIRRLGTAPTGRARTTPAAMIASPRRYAAGAMGCNCAWLVRPHSRCSLAAPRATGVNIAPASPGSFQMSRPWPHLLFSAQPRARTRPHEVR